ncbi:MAG: hypothetical protein SFV18_06190 [Bryobacteraceae bacterium]|nr:hypothetical protein [Bryobacteraceae bacterium]
MTIEITRPEVEILIQERIRSGAFATAEEAILQALLESSSRPTGAALVAAMQASPYPEIDLEPRSERLPVSDIAL